MLFRSVYDIVVHITLQRGSYLETPDIRYYMQTPLSADNLPIYLAAALHTCTAYPPKLGLPAPSTHQFEGDRQY